MMVEKNEKFLTVAPFKCAWREDLRFRDAGRGCVAFEAFACNDVTVVFRENVGSQHYHYKMDNSPHYTVILGSHKNRRLKIEVDGKTVVDVAGIGLCSTSAFQSYWISIYDGLICVGKGRYPFQNLVFQWLDSNPNCSVQYVGLSSWDKHVGYRNVSVMPLTQNHLTLWKHVDYVENKREENGEELADDECTGYEKWGLENFLENWELSDMFFVVGSDERLVPAHKAILEATGHFGLLEKDAIQLPCVTYEVLHALLQYIYTGQTVVSESQLDSLKSLSLQFEVNPLAKQCEEIIERFKMNKKLFYSGQNVEILFPSLQPNGNKNFPFGVPVNVKKLSQWLSTGMYSDVAIHIDGHGFISHPHRIILSLWSIPFSKMFTNGMRESVSSDIWLKDVSPEALKAILEFMYNGELSVNSVNVGVMLLDLLLLADQFGVTLLHQECCKIILECLDEGWKFFSGRGSYDKLFVDSVCSILEMIPSVPSCKIIEETCKRKFAVHFDYCTSASFDFICLDGETLLSVIQHPDLTVTSEEKVLNAILLWGTQKVELCGWEAVDEFIGHSTPDVLFGPKVQLVNELLLFVRFPLLPSDLLKKLEESNLVRQMLTLSNLVKEAIDFLESGLTRPENNHNVRFQLRRSSFKELQYVCDGDSNGVLYFAGTLYGKHSWVNPVLSKTISILASSPSSRFTDPKVLASRAYQGTCFAGSRVEDGKTCSWWMVDIGKDHQLMCNYYTLRQDGSRAYLRWWNLQGSLDGITWTNLRVHENDQTMCKAGQFASWPVTGPAALLPYRYFRVILTGPSADAVNPWNCCVCFLELYGYFH